MSDCIGWGIAGLGRRSRETIVPALLSLPGSRVAGVAGRDESRAREAARAWPDLKVYSSVDELALSPEVQALYICTPHYLHVPQAVHAIEAGKHVFMESPLALSVDGAHKLVEKARNKGVRLGVAFQYRFHPALSALHGEIQAGRLGEVELIEITLAEPAQLQDTWWTDALRSGPAALLRLGVHALDLAVWLKGGHAAEVAALGDEIDKGLNTISSALLKFPDGSAAALTGTTRLAGPVLRVHLEGSKGSARVHAGPEGAGLELSGPGGVSRQSHPPSDPVPAMMAAFAGSLAGGNDFHPDGADGKRVVEITCAVIESMKARRAVKVGEVARLT